MKKTFLGLCVVAALVCAAWAVQNLEAPNSLTLTSTAFKDGGTIPRVYSCQGKNVSPPLAWINTPAAAKSLALVCADPDAPGGLWVHWVVYGLDPAMTELPQGQPRGEYIAGGAGQGTTDFGSVGYGGPCPPPGKAHRYIFTLYALDTDPDLRPGLSLSELRKAMQGHILAEARLTGMYKR